METQDSVLQILPLAMDRYQQPVISRTERLPALGTMDGERFLHGLTFQLDHERTEFKRSVFTVFDLASALGGLAFLLYITAHAVVACLLKDSATLLLINQVFETHKNRLVTG